VDSGIPTLGADYTLQSIAAAVIGGVSLEGGSGTILGASFGALLLTVINNGLDLMNISSYVEMMVIGAIIVLAVYLDSLRKRSA
ncbi:MAG TPA: ABC transporter permease, partial [Spirochaetia bacterium]|nr:ABC transporter permease [Spirochaetia bacterium]